MPANYIYHVTKPLWLSNGTGRLCFRHYVRPPANEPYRDHAPLNAARQANPGSDVFATFFFSDEETAVTAAFVLLTFRPHVVLRANVLDAALSHLSHASDDRDLTPGAHMRYGHDKCAPVDTPDGCRVHPSWGIPFERLEIKPTAEAQWLPLAAYIAGLSDSSATAIGPSQHETTPTSKKATRSLWSRFMFWREYS